MLKFSNYVAISHKLYINVRCELDFTWRLFQVELPCSSFSGEAEEELVQFEERNSQ